MRLEQVCIPSRGVMLAGLLYHPERTPHATGIVLAHGFTSGKYSLDGLASYLAVHGYTCLTYDCVGHKLGASGGEMRHANQAVENLTDGLAWMRALGTMARIVLIGHSMGGIAAVAAAARDIRARPPGRPPLGGIVSLCAGANPSRAFRAGLGQKMLQQREDYFVGAPALRIVSELDSIAAEGSHLGGLPALFIAARHDILIALGDVEELARRAGPSAVFASVESSHLEAPDRSRGRILEWLEGKDEG
jgi:pimeloyl-ACP methyl ester carboxylesterase